MSLRIACDLDGTLADMDSALQREAARLFGADVDLHGVPGERLESAEDVEGTIARPRAGVSPKTRAGSGRRSLTAIELRHLWTHVGQIENFWTSLAEIEPGAVSRLATLARTHRWEVLFLTQRPSSAGDIVQIQSQRWLQAHGFELPSVMVMHGSRGKVAAALALDAVLDDRPENCLDVITDSKAKALLVWRFGAERVPPGIARTSIETVLSIAEALARLEQLMAERVRSQTFLGRLRSAIGAR